jgi:methylase of polypeptide subunit release factors
VELLVPGAIVLAARHPETRERGNRLEMEAQDQALVALGEDLQAAGYRFTSVTPRSHRCVNNRAENKRAASLEAVFGWNRPFRREDFPRRMVALLEDADELEICEDCVRSRVRFSSLADQLFVHSSFPTESADAVFFGPDTYRFARALKQALQGLEATAPFTIIDIGCGSGAGGLFAALQLLPQTQADIILSDINPKALRYARINAAINGIPNVRTVLSDVFDQINDPGNLIISNPPYLVDSSARLYRHGGREFGFELSLRIVDVSIDRLAPGGRLVLYTGTPVIGGVDKFYEALRPLIEARHCSYTYEEVDPDVFGEELEYAPYDGTDRIAVIVLTLEAGKESMS